MNYDKEEILVFKVLEQISIACFSETFFIGRKNHRNFCKKRKVLITIKIPHLKR